MVYARFKLILMLMAMLSILDWWQCSVMFMDNSSVMVKP